MIALVATIIHEVPHEFSDFALLLRDGYSRRNAILFQVFFILDCKIPVTFKVETFSFEFIIFLRIKISVSVSNLNGRNIVKKIFRSNLMIQIKYIFFLFKANHSDGRYNRRHSILHFNQK